MPLADRSQTIRDGYLPVPGGQVWFQIVGHGAAAPLLVLHGGPGVPHDYLEPVGRLGLERPVVFYDQLGCGRSDRPDDPQFWQVEHFMRELAIMREQLGLERVHLLGHSWGSMLAIDYALSRPDGLLSLTLVSPPLCMPRWHADVAALRQALPAEVRETLERHEAAGTTDSPGYEAATLVFYQRHLCRLDPWPEPVIRSFAGVGRALNQAMWGISGC